MKNKTTKEHYDKYQALAQRLGVKFDADTLRFFGVASVEKLRELFQADPLLNNIPLRRFDNWTESFNLYNRGARLTLAEGCCLAKHCLIYQVLGVEPEFDNKENA
jgi:hypothetical protein